MASTLSASAKGASYLILIQVSSRALTFLINQILLRYLSPALLGASMQLELYYITVLYFARESLRVTLQRRTSNLQAVINVAYIPFLIGLPISLCAGVLYEHGNPPPVPYMIGSLRLYGLSALVELISEPCFAVVQQQLVYQVRAAAETTATIARCVATFGVAVLSRGHGRDTGVLPFAVGQMAYAACLTTVYVFQTTTVARKNGAVLVLRVIDNTWVTLLCHSSLVADNTQARK